MKLTTTRSLAAAAGAIAFASTCPLATAQTTHDIQPIIFYSGFEAPAYLAGPLAGQDKWAAEPGKPGTLAATVEKGAGQYESQAVRISADRLHGVSTEWSRPIPYQMNEQMPILRVEWDALLASGKVPSANWETCLYGPKGSLLCGLQITPAGAMYLLEGPQIPPMPKPIALNVWNHFEMRLNFNASTADFFINDIPLTAAPIPLPVLAPQARLGSISFEVLNPGSDAAIIDFISVQPQPFVCRANCDGSVDPPILNVNDFICFQKAFITALDLPYQFQVNSYANFDGSLIDPVLTVNDYMAFLSAFAAGCR